MAAYSEREIEYLIEPTSEALFFERHWDRTRLHVPGVPGKFRDVYDIEAYRARRSLCDLKACSKGPNGLQHQVPIDPARIEAALAAGMTICADVSADPLLAPFLDGFQDRLRLAGGPPFAKLYASNDGAGFTLHTDAHHVFVLQIEGSKRWRVSAAPAISSPIHGFHLDESGAVVSNPPRDGELARADDGTPLVAPRPEELETVVLEEGDCLYLPPGTWHAAEARGRSVAVSVSPPRASVFSVMMRTLEDMLLMRQEWRRDVVVPIGESHLPGKTYPSVERTFADRIDDLREQLRAIDPRAFHRVWRLNVRGSGGLLGPAPAPSPGPHARAPIRRPDMLRLVPRSLECLLAPAPDGGGEVLFFYYAGAEWCFPAAALRFMTALAERREFRAEAALAWDDSLDWDFVSEVLQSLLDAGILARLEPR